MCWPTDRCTPLFLRCSRRMIHFCSDRFARTKNGLCHAARRESVRHHPRRGRASLMLAVFVCPNCIAGRKSRAAWVVKSPHRSGVAGSCGRSILASTGGSFLASAEALFPPSLERLDILPPGNSRQQWIFHAVGIMNAVSLTALPSTMEPGQLPESRPPGRGAILSGGSSRSRKPDGLLHQPLGCVPQRPDNPRSITRRLQ
jgi:hypothetical protein